MVIWNKSFLDSVYGPLVGVLVVLSFSLSMSAIIDGRLMYASVSLDFFVSIWPREDRKDNPLIQKRNTVDWEIFVA